MTSQNGPRHGATQQPWWDEQQPVTARIPSQIPAQRGAPAPGAQEGPPAPEVSRGTGRRLARWSGVLVATVLVLAIGMAIGGSGTRQETAAAAPASSSADQGRIATLEQQLADAQRSNQTLQSELDSRTTAPPVPAAPAIPAAPVETGPATTVSDGTYEVGVDLAPGRYKTPGPNGSGALDMCYVARSRNDSGELGSIIANDIAQGSSSVTVKKGEFAKFSGGCTWTKQ